MTGKHAPATREHPMPGTAVNARAVARHTATMVQGVPRALTAAPFGMAEGRCAAPERRALTRTTSCQG